MGKIQRFEDLEIWQKGARLAVDMILLMKQPSLKHEYEIRGQLIRAAFSISNNIAEGFEYNNDKQFKKFLEFSKGSCGEVRSMLHIICMAELITKNDFDKYYSTCEALSKQIKSLIDYLDKPK